MQDANIEIDSLAFKLGQINLQRSKAATASAINFLISSKYKIACLQDYHVSRGRPYGLPQSIPFYQHYSAIVQSLSLMIPYSTKHGSKTYKYKDMTTQYS